MNNITNDVVTIDFDLPFPVHVSEEPFNVDVKGVVCKLQFQMVTRNSADPRLRLGELELGLDLDNLNFDLDQDRYGWIRFSKVNVSIPLNQLPPTPMRVKYDEWPIEIATSAVNTFVEQYRDLRNASWIRRINPTEVWAMNAIWFERGIPTRIVNHRRLHQIRSVIPPIEPKEEKILRQRLGESQPVSAFKQRLLDAEDALSRGDAALAIILGQAAIEGAVTTLLIQKYRKNKPLLSNIRKEFGIKKVLCYEALVEEILLYKKLSRGLDIAIGRDISKDATLWYECDEANSIRIACVHHGHKPSLQEARKVLNTYLRIYHEYLELDLLNDTDISIDFGSDGIHSVRQVLNRVPSNRLCDLIDRVLSKLRKRLLFYHIDKYPLRKYREVNLASEDRGSYMIFWINPNEDIDKNETLIARAIIHRELIQDEYPYTMVANSLPDETTRTNWELFCNVLNQAILGLYEDKYVEELGFNIDELTQAKYKSTKEQFLSPDFVDPQSHELDSLTIPLQLMRLYFNLDKDNMRQELLCLVTNNAPGISANLACLLKAVQEVGYNTREDCVQLMAKCRSCFFVLDSCLVVDPKERLIYYSIGPQRY